MNLQFRTVAVTWAVATIVATAVDVCLSAANGYSLRVDALLMLVLELGGVGLVTAAAIAGLTIGFALLRRVMVLLPMPGTFAYAVALAPLTLLVVWRHHQPIPLVVIAVLLLDVLTVAWLEVRTRFTLARPMVAFFCVIASVGSVVAAIALPLPGRSQIGEAPSTPAPPRQGPNLIMIALDTLRADHLGAYGYERKITPWLDEFAQGATVYEHVMASSSYTLPTHATLFTGLFAETHGAIEMHDHDGSSGVSLKELGLQADWAKVAPLPDEAVTLAEVLHERGYETGAICANTAYLARSFNLDQGFNTYVDAMGSRASWRPLGLSILVRLPFPGRWRIERMLGSNERYYLFAHEVDQLAYRWMRGRADRPFFLFLNFMEAHAPYLPLPGYRDLFPDSYARQTMDWDAINKDQQPITPAEKSSLVDAYDAEIKSMDDRLRELFAQLKTDGALDNTIVVFVADHGESFGEHGKLGHALTVYQPEVWVPMIVKLPGQKEGKREARFVQTTDLMPTLLREMGAPVPDVVEGTDLGESTRKFPIVAYFGPYERDYTEYAVYSEPWKMITTSNKPVQLFNLQDDPAEKNNLAESAPDKVKELQALLDAYHARPTQRLSAGPMTLDPETAERLKSMGYGEK